MKMVFSLKIKIGYCADLRNSLSIVFIRNNLLCLHLVRNSQFMSSFSSSACQHSSTIFSAHSGSESVLIYSFTPWRLERPFHRIWLFFQKVGQRY